MIFVRFTPACNMFCRHVYLCVPFVIYWIGVQWLGNPQLVNQPPKTKISQETEIVCGPSCSENGCDDSAQFSNIDDKCYFQESVTPSFDIDWVFSEAGYQAGLRPKDLQNFWQSSHVILIWVRAQVILWTEHFAYALFTQCPKA